MNPGISHTVTFTVNIPLLCTVFHYYHPTHPHAGNFPAYCALHPDVTPDYYLECPSVSLYPVFEGQPG